MPPTLSREQLVAKLAAQSIHEANGCIRWAGIVRKDGYVCIRWQNRLYQLHRLAWELRNGEIPPEMTLDHLCHTWDQDCAGGPSCLHRSCYNLAHLEVVSGPENTRRQFQARKPSCVNGHPFTEQNTYRGPVGGARRHCRACNRQRVAEYNIRKQMRAAGIEVAA